MDTTFLTKYSMLNGPIPYLSVCVSFTHSITYNGFVHLMWSNTESKNKIKLLYILKKLVLAVLYNLSNKKKAQFKNGFSFNFNILKLSWGY